MEDSTETDLREDLRREALTARKRIPETERKRRSEELCGQLLDVLDAVIEDAGRPASDCIVTVYAATGSEVGLDAFIEAAYGRGVGLAFPCMFADTDATSVSTTCEATMGMRLVDETSYRSGAAPFVNDPFQVLTADDPRLAPYPPVAATDPILTVVPLVAFDTSGNRLGYGQGNYDRYLAKTGPANRSVGVAFAEQEVGGIPALAHDRRLEILTC
ncbi:MAG: hypothetical protein LUD25_00840 [Coriobacteriaceae bacterium]|nr:hypothetical protein [Coriobacteriaceae bacterium]